LKRAFDIHIIYEQDVKDFART